MLEAYKGGVLFGNSPVDTAREIKLLGIDAERADDVEKVQISARGEYLVTALLLRFDRWRYGELTLLLKILRKTAEELSQDTHIYVRANGGV